MGSFVVFERLTASFGASSAPISTQPGVILAGLGFVLQVSMSLRLPLAAILTDGFVWLIFKSPPHLLQINAIRTTGFMHDALVARWNGPMLYGWFQS